MGRDWTDADKAKLKALAKAKVSSKEAAKQLKRSPGATRYKAMELGVKFRSNGRKK